MQKQHKVVQALLVAAAVIGLTGIFTGTARADEDGWRHHERYEHQRYVRDGYWHRERHVEYRHYYYDRDGRLEVYYNTIPPMEVVRPSAPAAFNIVIPLDLR